MIKKHCKSILLITEDSSIAEKITSICENISVKSGIIKPENLSKIKNTDKYCLVLIDISKTDNICLKSYEAFNVPLVFFSNDNKVPEVIKSDLLHFGIINDNTDDEYIKFNLQAFLRLSGFINELIQKDAKLLKSERNLELTLNSIGDAVISTDAEGNVVHMNPIAEKLCGWRSKSAIGKPLSKVFKIINSISRKPVNNPVSKVLKNGLVVGLANHTSLLSRTGKEYQIADSAAPIFDEAGKITGVVMVFTDITKDYALRKQIEDSEKKYRALFNNTNDGIALHEIVYENGKAIDYIILDVNPKYEEYTGLIKEKIIGKRATKIYKSKKAPYLHKFYSVVKTKRNIDFETYYKPFDKHYQISVFSPEENKFATVFQDISARKLAERQLIEREQQFRMLAENYPNGFIVVYDKNYRYLLVEGNGLEDAGLSRGMLIGQRIKDVFPKQFCNKIEPHIKRAFEGETLSFEIMWENQFFTETVIPLYKNNKITEVMGVVTNITEWKKNELQKKENEERVNKQRLSIVNLLTNENIKNAIAPECFNTITKAISETIEARRASIWILSNELDEMECISLFDSTQNNHLSGVRLKSSDYPRYFESIQNEGIISAENALADPRTSEFTENYLRPLNIMSMLDAGIISEGKLIGVICVENTIEFRKWQSDEIAYISTTASLVAQIFSSNHRRKAEIQMEYAKNKAEESDKLKTAFLQNISHEIRTPLNGIIGFCSLLNDIETISLEEKRNYVEMISYSSERLLAVVNDIIEMSRIDSGFTKNDINRFPIIELSHYFEELLNQQTSDKNISYAVNSPDKLKNLLIETDKDKLYQIITNLINNAVKFTDEGSVSLILRKKDSGLFITVKDSGIGIDKQYHSKIFERFWQHESLSRNKYGGTGLGLSISKALADNLGFTIKIRSTLGKGSEFTIQIPEKYLIIPSKKEISNEASQNGYKPLPPIKVLIVEDDLVNYKYLFSLLKKSGINSDWAENGIDALKQLETKSFDLILMDLKMPILGGHETTKIIKSKYPKIKVIAQTAYVQPEEQRKSEESGFDYFIKKPIRRQELTEVIMQLFKE